MVAVEKSINQRPKRPEIFIRRMDIDDISAVFHLGEQLFTSEDLPTLYRTWDSNEVTGYFSSDSDYCFVAETKPGKVVGFIIGTTINTARTAWKKYGYVVWLGVDDGYQRTGLGLRLYHKLEEQFQDEGARMIIADTEFNNKDAISFFKSVKFKLMGRHVYLAKTIKKPVQRYPERR